MSNIITNQLKINNSKNFLDSITLSSGNSLYMFFGKPNNWKDDSNIPAPKDNQDNVTEIWDDMVSLKRILPENVIHVVKRINWVVDTIYDEYTNLDDALFEKPFYVLNSELNVYKCISNNNGRSSTIEPTGRNFDIITLADKYRWKYLYNISIGNKLKFLTNNWMPVLTDEDVAANSNKGSIEQIKILNGGIGYSALSTVSINGDGQDVEITPKLDLGVIYDFNYTNIGTNYRHATGVINDSTGSGKYANIQIIVSPINGHGYDPVTELGSHSLMFNSKTDYNEGFGDFPGNFSYRKIGIIKNPIDVYNNIANAATLSSLSGINLQSVNGTFTQNEFIEGRTSFANAYVVTANITAGNGYIKFVRSFDLTSNYTNFDTEEYIIGKTSGATAKVVSSLEPEVMRNKGDLYYIEHRTPVIRSTNQTDNLHLVIEF
jgi:hypothetical protein